MKKKGFTLIELLAVIVILAIIALIAVPVIMNIISSARKSAFEDTAYGIIKAGELYYAQALLNDGMTGDAEFTFNEGAVSPEGLSVQGSLPQSGKLVVTRDGKTAIAISNGTYCVTKGYEESKISTTDEFESCDLPAGTAKTLSELAKTNDFATTVNACATSGTCAPGTAFAIEVAPGEIKNFYVVSDANNKVILIMDRNVDEETVEWINELDHGCGEIGDWCATNEKGPITAIKYLEQQTANWTNVPTFNYIYSDENTTKKYEDISRIGIKARMLTKTEALSVGCVEGDTVCPTWLYENLTSSTPSGYWTSSAYTDSVAAWGVSSTGIAAFFGPDFLYYESYWGVRPVIEISKSNI